MSVGDNNIGYTSLQADVSSDEQLARLLQEEENGAWPEAEIIHLDDDPFYVRRERVSPERAQSTRTPRSSRPHSRTRRVNALSAASSRRTTEAEDRLSADYLAARRIQEQEDAEMAASLTSQEQPSPSDYDFHHHHRFHPASDFSLAFAARAHALGGYGRDATYARFPSSLGDADQEASINALLDGDSQGNAYEALLALDESVKKAGLSNPDAVSTRARVTPEMAANQDECPICLDTFEAGQVYRILPCMDKFHQKCIDRHFTDNTLCPICQKDPSTLASEAFM